MKEAEVGKMKMMGVEEKQLPNSSTKEKKRNCSCRWEWNEWSIAHRMPKHFFNHDEIGDCGTTLSNDTHHSQAYAASVEEWLDKEQYSCAIVLEDNIAPFINEMIVRCMFLYRGTLSSEQMKSVKKYYGCNRIREVSHSEWALAHTNRFVDVVFVHDDVNEPSKGNDGECVDNKDQSHKSGVTL